jgi:lysophospholipase L1-like esterase
MTTTLLARTGALPKTTPNPNLLRVLGKLTAGTAIKVTFLGDSGLEGGTVTVPGTDDCASRLCAGLATRFGATVTKSNRAVSGNTFAHALDPTVVSPTRFASALADAADLYVISYGHNDIRAESFSATYAPTVGYPINAGRAALEHMIRRIRIDVPEADIIVSSEWPYTGASTATNTYLLAHGTMMRRVAAQYGCAFADYYQHLLGLGVNNGAEDSYVWAVGAVGTNASAQHPNNAGHAAWSDLLLSLLPKLTTLAPAPAPPAPLGAPLFGAERYTHTEMLDIPNYTGAVLPARWRVSGTWSSSTTTPTISSTATNFAEVQAIGTEVRLRLDSGVGQGIVKIECDGAIINATLDLSAALGGGSQPYFPITGLTPGAHRIVVTVVSGSVTFRGAVNMPAIGHKIPYTSALITYTGSWADGASDPEVFDLVNHRTTTQNDTVAVTFFGTGLALSGVLYAAAWSIGVTTDGGSESVQDWNTGGTLTQYGCRNVVSGLAYGRHTVSLKLLSTGRAIRVSHFFAFDETRTARPNRVAGFGVVGEAVNYGNPLPASPVVLLSADDATSLVPANPTTPTSSGFTVAGTAASRHQWVADGGRCAY